MNSCSSSCSQPHKNPLYLGMAMQIPISSDTSVPAIPISNLTSKAGAIIAISKFLQTSAALVSPNRLWSALRCFGVFCSSLRRSQMLCSSKRFVTLSKFWGYARKDVLGRSEILKAKLKCLGKLWGALTHTEALQPDHGSLLVTPHSLVHLWAGTTTQPVTLSAAALPDRAGF